jgi:hypothetical protein
MVIRIRQEARPDPTFPDIKRFDVNRVDQISANMREFSDIKKVIIIGHSGVGGIYVGSGSIPNSNISANPGSNNVSPYSMPWSGLTPDADIELWGCNSSWAAQDFANAANRSTMGFNNKINFDSDGQPFVRWYRAGGEQRFSPK